MMDGWGRPGFSSRKEKLRRLDVVVWSRMKNFDEPTKADLREQLAQAMRNTAALEVEQ